MTKVLMVASEAAPYAKTGGLADVVGSLPAALRSIGVPVAVLIPRYRGVEPAGARRVYDRLTIWLGATRYETSVYQAGEEVPYYFLDCPELYDREGLYGTPKGDFPDNHIRFAVLSRAALEVARRLFRPDVIHCHDWQAGLVPAYLKTTLAGDPTFVGVKTLFTIHNIGYQGLFPKAALAEVGLDTALFQPGGVEYYGKLSFIKAGIVYSDALNTVSKAYAREIQTAEYGFGLEGLLATRSAVLSGILNGVDYSYWSPETDRFLPANYSAADLEGKRVCKQVLLRQFGLDGEEAPDRPSGSGIPTIGIVSRLVGQKGADLIVEIGGKLAEEDMRFVVMGAGEARFEKAFLELAAAYPTRIAARIGVFDEPLAHLIEAGSDMFLMPSRYEPCGLNQIYSLRYGTIPIVRATGGLDDTIDENIGFKFKEYTGAALLGAIQAALAEFRRPDEWAARMQRAMSKDFSWDVSAREYASLYGRLNLSGG